MFDFRTHFNFLPNSLMKIVIVIFKKGIDICSKSGTLLITENSRSADVCKKAFFLENGFFGMFIVCY